MEINELLPGLFIDDLNKTKVRLLDSDSHHLTAQLVAECDDYLGGIKDFKSAVDQQFQLLTKLRALTERQKFEVIRKRSELASFEFQKETLRNKLIMELEAKEIILARTKEQYEAMNMVRREQHDVLQMLHRR